MSSRFFRWFEDGKVVEEFPCRCGKTHSGDYAMEDHIMHECFHEDITFMPEDDPRFGPEVMLSCSCGKTWQLSLEGLTPYGLQEVAGWVESILNKDKGKAS